MDAAAPNPFRCPQCAGPLESGAARVTCSKGHAFPVADGIPVLLREQAYVEQYAKQIAYFSAESSSYASDHVLSPWMRKFVDMVAIGCGPIEPGMVALDIGCGTGYMSIELARMGCSVLAADLTTATMRVLAAKVAKLGLASRVTPAICSALDLPLADGSVDIVVANAVIEHLPDDRRFVAEVARVLKPGGKGVFVAPVKLGLVWPFFWLVNAIHDRRIGHLRRYSEGSFRQLLDAHGLELGRVAYSGHLVKVVGTLAQMLLRSHRWDEALERIDATTSGHAYGSSNIAVTFTKPGEGA